MIRMENVSNLGNDLWDDPGNDQGKESSEKI